MALRERASQCAVLIWLATPSWVWADAVAPTIEPLVSHKNPVFLMLWPGFVICSGLAIWGWRRVRDAKRDEAPDPMAFRGALLCTVLALALGVVAVASGDGRGHPDPDWKPLRYPRHRGPEVKVDPPPPAQGSVKTTSPR